MSGNGFTGLDPDLTRDLADLSASAGENAGHIGIEAAGVIALAQLDGGDVTTLCSEIDEELGLLARLLRARATEMELAAAGMYMDAGTMAAYRSLWGSLADGVGEGLDLSGVEVAEVVAILGWTQQQEYQLRHADADAVIGPDGTFYGVARPPSQPSELDAFTLEELRETVAGALAEAFDPRTETAPPNASLGPDAEPYEYEVSGPGYPDGEGLGSLTSLFAPSIIVRLMDYYSAPSAVNQNWPEEIDQLAANKGIEWSGPYQVDAAATSATGATIFTIAAQRLPSADPNAAAVTYGHFVFYDVDSGAAIQRPDGTYEIDPGILAHEMVHVAQWEQNGDAFVERYLVDQERWEDEAYEVGP